MFAMTPISRWLRIFTGLTLVIAVLFAGFARHSPQVVLWLALAFTLSYVGGRFAAWFLVYQQGKLRAALSGLPLTFVVQLLLVSVLYLLGVGASVLWHNAAGLRSVGAFAYLYPLAVGSFGVAMGLIISWLEMRGGVDLCQHRAMDQDSPDGPPTRAELALSPDPVTMESFFSNIHYSHFSKDPDTGESKAIPNERSSGSLKKIAATESRLAIRFPLGLAALYLHQNGGGINNICVPKVGIAEVKMYDDVIKPFSGYDDLHPLEIVNSLYDAISNYADPELQPEEFPEACQRLIVLARWYSETLFLDYRQPGEPRVGFVNFEDMAGWQERCVWWSSFDEFFSQCRHYNDL